MKEDSGEPGHLCSLARDLIPHTHKICKIQTKSPWIAEKALHKKASGYEKDEHRDCRPTHCTVMKRHRTQTDSGGSRGGSGGLLEESYIII